MDTKHTPGPWTANLHHTQQVGGRTYGFITADGIVPIAAVVLGVEGMPQDEGRANARVFAAARDMLAAILTTVCPAGHWTGRPDDVDPTVENCLRHGQCACDLGAAVRKAGASPAHIERE